ncbi:DegT/DnrJ/EryC1/StrS family aminotransferase [Methanoplanus limicola]|uniref:DegT/DnrJ/EryC1/StrS aminotransferase n=1 Tax=Methanoplanus limicola DSM 2279 TaxID=937775 RepID=H1YZT8_9EURY|nr:DegT/DnrJ/EryC1/StrS family aminotransferase [Methanoplanus limicola]EHQ34350.1 DegT/DnrJ/EryC1/StrS aminotransferase [Methanoplanus limicola DSM 2279]
MIPVAKPFIGEEEIEAVAGVMRSGMIACGSVVSEFEKEFSEFIGTKEAVGVNSGTAALHAALLALGISKGDDVIVPSFTFFATASAVSLCGAKPVCVDVDEKTFNISPDEIMENLSFRTKAVIGVHLFGQAFDLKPVTEICEDNNLLLIEDCAQAHGAEYKGKKVGSFGDAGCFSFYPTKNMTTGEGGMITCNDSKSSDKIRRIINHGQSEKYLHTEIGYNMRMSDIDAAIGRVQFSKLSVMNKLRRRNAGIYDSEILHQGITKPFNNPDCLHVYHQYAVLVEDNFPMERDELMKYLASNGIGSAVHYPVPVHRQPVYADMPNPKCPVADDLSRRILSLPVHPGVSEDECRYICEVINEISG